MSILKMTNVDSNRKKKFDIDADTYRRAVTGDKDAMDEIKEKEPIPKFFKWLFRK